MADEAPRTRIVFAGGAEVTVPDGYDAVLSSIYDQGRKPGLVEFRGPDDERIAVAADHIAYIEPA